MPSASSPEPSSVWAQCLARLNHELSNQQMNTWIRPLQADTSEGVLCLWAPNEFILGWVKEHFLPRIEALIIEHSDGDPLPVVLNVGEQQPAIAHPQINEPASAPYGSHTAVSAPTPKTAEHHFNSRIDTAQTFAEFVKGNSNEMAAAAASQVAANPGKNNNPLYMYGGVGLGKTHLMHAIGNEIMNKNPQARVVFINSERFVQEMVRALQHGQIDQFKRFYRSVDALLVDDIQFLAGKDRSQEEFFHTFNALLEGKKQLVLTCDRYPREIDGLEDRLKSRLGWGLTVQINPPELETRVAILINKAKSEGWALPDDVAFFIAKRIQSNVRELEGALRRVIARAEFKGAAIDNALARDALQDLLHLQERMVTVDNIQRTVAEYYRLSVSQLTSTSRSRSIARPRQMAMALSKELTNNSLPEIARAFNKKDHTTVLHACNKIKDLRTEQTNIEDDYNNLVQKLRA